MKINRGFIASQGAKQLPSNPGGCCATAASKQFVFGNQESEPCCSEGLPFSPWEPPVLTQNGFYDTPTFNLSDYIPRDCECSIRFIIDTSDPTVEIYIFVNGNPIQLNWVGFQITYTHTFAGTDFFYFSMTTFEPCSIIGINALNAGCNNAFIGNIYTITMNSGGC